jgi:hypothetical protein
MTACEIRLAQDYIETGSSNGYQHGPNRILEALENPDNSEHKKGQGESPGADTVVGNTVVEYPAGGVKELKDLPTEREGNNQDQDADTYIEGNGLSRQGGNVL